MTEDERAAFYAGLEASLNPQTAKLIAEHLAVANGILADMPEPREIHFASPFLRDGAQKEYFDALKAFEAKRGA